MGSWRGRWEPKIALFLRSAEGSLSENIFVLILQGKFLSARL